MEANGLQVNRAGEVAVVSKHIYIFFCVCVCKNNAVTTLFFWIATTIEGITDYDIELHQQILLPDPEMHEYGLEDP